MGNTFEASCQCLQNLADDSTLRNSLLISRRILARRSDWKAYRLASPNLVMAITQSSIAMGLSGKFFGGQK
jgi:hypothetical protein